MKYVIFEDHNSNMAGSQWKTIIWLRRTKHNGYSLHANGTSNDDEYPLPRWPAVRNLHSATDVYEAVAKAFEWAEIDFDENNLTGIAHEIASFDADLAKGFEAAPAVIAAREEKEATERCAALAPFLDAIDRLLPSPKSPGERMGGGFTAGHVHGIKKRRLEEYILKHGQLPDVGQSW